MSNPASLTARQHGEKNGRSKLTATQVRKIRSLSEAREATYDDLAEMFGISRVNVWKIVTRRTWKTLP